MSREAEFFRRVAERRVVRPRVAAVVIADGRLLVQRPNDDPSACYAFIGGEYELGDTFESRLKAEINEETTAHVRRTQYLFVVENRFWHGETFVHSLEHYLRAELDRDDVRSREAYLDFHWLPVEDLIDFDLRPHIVRDAIASGEYTEVRHLVVPYG